MKWKADKHEPVASGKLQTGQLWEIYEEFGLYSVYVSHKLKSTHDTFEKAFGKVRYINSIDRANNHGSNMSPRQKSERSKNND